MRGYLIEGNFMTSVRTLPATTPALLPNVDRKITRLPACPTSDFPTLVKAQARPPRASDCGDIADAGRASAASAGNRRDARTDAHLSKGIAAGINPGGPATTYGLRR